MPATIVDFLSRTSWPWLTAGQKRESVTDASVSGSAQEGTDEGSSLSLRSFGGDAPSCGGSPRERSCEVWPPRRLIFGGVPPRTGRRAPTYAKAQVRKPPVSQA